MLNYPGYVFEAWHGTLLMIAISLFAVLFNTVLARKLPLVEGIVLVVYICAFIGIIVTLWVLAPRSDAAAVFGGFTDAGWHSLGGSALIGITAGILPLVGADAAVHMSEGKLELDPTGLPPSSDSNLAMRRCHLFHCILGAHGWVDVDCQRNFTPGN